MRSILLFCLLTLAAGPACGGLEGGPSLPAGAHWATFSREASVGPTARQPGMLAAPSLSDLRSQVIAVARQGNEECVEAPNYPNFDTCWYKIADRPGVLYVAVATYNECTRPTKNKIAAGADVLYFAHWIGDSHGICSAAMAEPHYELFVVQRPPQVPGPLSIQLLVEESSGNNSVIAQTIVSLS